MTRDLVDHISKTASSLTELCAGLQQAYKEPVSTEDVHDDQDGEAESNTTESWRVTEAHSKKVNVVLDLASQGVSDNTYNSYIW
jgi:hypothetical protein